MSFMKIFKFGMKGAKKAKKAGGAKGGEAVVSKWPPGIKVGVFGHENSGKSVFFTILYRECKIAKNIQISVTDKATSYEFLSNYRAIWGIAPAGQTGTIVDKKTERKFPDPTEKDSLLQFTAILDRKDKIPVVTYDYNGKALSISEQVESTEKVIDFMTAADGLLFFFDPKIMGAELEIQARVSAFINMLERIAPLKSPLPIPVGLVITKADTLPGFKGEDQCVLIRPEDEQFIAEDFEFFLEKALGGANVAADSEWAGTVRNILVKLREFLRVVVGRTLNFQIFFTSNTGNKPEKIGTDVGRSVYSPPEKITPCGVKEPFYWILQSIMRNRKIGVLRKITKFTAAASLIWIVLFSLPFMIHFGVLLSKPARIERSVLKSVDYNHLNTSESQRGEIYRNYDRYARSWLVRTFFPGYRVAGNRMAEVYKNFNLGKTVTRLDNIINSFTGVVNNKELWPKYNPSKDSLIYSDNHTKIVEGLEGIHVGDESSVLYTRSDRALTYWNLFGDFIRNPNDSSVVARINEQAVFDRENAQNFGDSEKRLGEALQGIATQKVQAKAGTSGYAKLKKRINASDDPAFRLGEAADELRKIRGSLSGDEAAAVGAYLAAVEKYNKKQTYTCVLKAVPDFGHLHIEVTASGQKPTWSKQDQLLEGAEVRIKWKVGDDIHIALDELKHECNWGKNPSDKIVFPGKYALFSMEGNITFPNIGKTVTISFKGGLKDNLPKLK